MLDNSPYCVGSTPLFVSGLSLPFCGSTLIVDPRWNNVPTNARWECGHCCHTEILQVGTAWSTESVVASAKDQAWRHVCRVHPEAIDPLFAAEWRVD